MICYTDNIRIADKILLNKSTWGEKSKTSFENSIQPLTNKIFQNKEIYTVSKSDELFWKHLLITDYSQFSQFDLLASITKNNISLPDRILCFAGRGKKFHGYRNRSWSTLPGNLHLSAYLYPNRPVNYFHIGFTILSAVSVIQTIDSIPGLNQKAWIKWVNDIIIDEKKISGVITQSQSVGNIVNGVILGIGINVESSPNIEPTLFVPETASLNDFLAEEVKLRFVFDRLVNYLNENYQILIKGDYKKLFNIYKERSYIIGKKVIIFSDPKEGNPEKIEEGTVVDIGKDLELYLDNQKKPITQGRLVIK